MSKLANAAALRKASDPGTALAEAVQDGTVKMNAILKAVNIDASKPEHQAALLVAQRYGLDPLMSHVLVLPQGSKPYISRDGYLHVAHRSGQLDGIEVLEEGETPTEFSAKVAVWRKDMSRAFVFTATYPKSGQNKQYAREMAITRAERRALKRAFNISDDFGEEVAADTLPTQYVDVHVVDTPALDAAPDVVYEPTTLLPQDAA